MGEGKFLFFVLVSAIVWFLTFVGHNKRGATDYYFAGLLAGRAVVGFWVLFLIGYFIFQFIKNI